MREIHVENNKRIKKKNQKIYNTKTKNTIFLNRQCGITLIALVVTVVILLILSGVTINMLLGENGIIRTAQEAKNTWESSITNEQQEIKNLVNELNNIMNNENISEDETETPEEPELEDITTVTEIVQKEEGEKTKDTYGNVVVVPKGFKVVTSEATTVPEGIVIEDINGNQFVWIPVGQVYKDKTGTDISTIQLGRYTFDTTNGTPTVVQLAYTEKNPTNYINTEGKIGLIDDNGLQYTELSIYREGVASQGADGLNATAKNLAGFVQSVVDNGGYYIARYEASYASGSNTTDWKPLSKVSTGYSQSNTPTLVQGILWNSVTQLEASKICQNMYKNDNTVGVESDLINSYAWDTAIIFIQNMKEENSNYANKIDGNGTLQNTGKTKDEVCNIYDLAANLREWTTEYCIQKDNSNAFACTSRGAHFFRSDYYTALRRPEVATYYNLGWGFRMILYIK